MIKATALFFLLFLFHPLTAPLYAQWPWNPATGLPVCTAVRNQLLPQSVSDGKGGAIVLWMDERATLSYYTLYVQRVDRSGVTRWTSNGIAMTSLDGSHLSPHIIADGHGGAIVTWHETRNGTNDIFAQRIDSTGNLLWTDGGAPVFVGTYQQSDPALCSDDSGGAIIVWTSSTGGNPFGDDHVWSQRIKADGSQAWPATGIRLCGAIRHQHNPAIVPDGSGGAIVAWHDYRTSNFDVYTQRVTSLGTPLWTTNGIKLSGAGGDQFSVKMVPDGKGGAYVAWLDLRDGESKQGVYVQRVTMNGAVPWASDGLHVTTTSGKQNGGAIASDGNNGVIVAFNEIRTGADPDIFAQCIDSTGALKWGGTGADVCRNTANQYPPAVESDNAGGAILAWEDRRPGTSSDVYAQRIDANGAPVWAANGIAVGSAAGTQAAPCVMNDDAGGGIFAYEDYRVDAGNGNVYAFKVNADGSYPVAPALLQLNKKSLAFGSIRKGSTKELAFTITNGGGSALQVSSIDISNPVFSTAYQPGSIASGQTVNVNVRFAPTALGAQTGRMLIFSNSPASPDTVTFTGTGLGTAVAQLSLATMNFGGVKVGESKRDTFRVTNVGDDTLKITSITTSNSVYRVSTAARTLLPGAGMKDTVTFIPTLSGPFAANLIITSNDPGSPDTIRLTGSGTGAGVADMQISLAQIAFGTVDIGRHADTILTIQNKGTDTLFVTDVSATVPAFSALPNRLTVAPGGTKTDTIRFAPPSPGAIAGLLILQSNSVSTPDTIFVSGIGRGTPGIAATPSQLPFGDVEIGKNSEKVVSIQNTGNDTLVVSDVTSSAGAFSARPRSFRVAPGASADDTIRFAPVATGVAGGTITITSNAPTSPTLINVSGNGIPAVGVRDVPAPTVFSFVSVHPNPASSAMSITFELGAGAEVDLYLVSALGNRIGRIEAQLLAPGRHTYEWNALNLAPGAYYCILRASGSMIARPVLIVR